MTGVPGQERFLALLRSFFAFNTLKWAIWDGWPPIRSLVV